MSHYLLLSRSITHAQRMQTSLRRVGIYARIFRPPLGLSDRGCGYAVRIAPAQFAAGIECLAEDRLLPERVFCGEDDGAYHEIKPL